MKRKWLLYSLVVFLGSTFIIGYSIFNPNGAIPVFVSKANQEDLMKGIQTETLQAKQIDLSFNKAYEAFTYQLLKEVKSNEKNVFVSPLSIYQALGLCLSGANGDTRKEMEKLLIGINKTSVLQDSLYAWKYSFNSLSKNKLDIANSIWYRNEFKPKQDFLVNNAKYYQADAYKIDFSHSNATNQINDWVKSHTNGLIDKMIDQLSADDVMVLLNTIYFKADWQSPFEKQYNTENDFLAYGKEKVKVTYMHQSISLPYVDIKVGKVIWIPYEENRFGMWVFLPNEGVSMDTALQTVSSMGFSTMKKNAKTRLVNLSFPKFETSTELDLNNVLIKMGMPLAFDASKADLSLMGDVQPNRLFISEVKHKTKIKLNEQGTEAAASTSVQIKVTSMPDSNKIDMNVNRPFMYGIVDTNTNLPIMIGVMQNPNQK